ncbi:MAG: Maf family protein [Acidobacteriota bacterium]|nr:Maf family protein [Acidobacteriota bacterium]
MSSARVRRQRPMILASRSPRRLQLLRMVGLRPLVRVPCVDESPRPRESGRAVVVRLAESKAMDVARRHPRAFVLAADSLVLVAGQMLGKPSGREDARRMLGLLSGGWHQVVTGVALVRPARSCLVAISRTRVRFASLTPEEIRRYAAGDEPYDKAGAYAIQGAAGWFVEEIRGSLSNVIGLPLEEVRRLLAEARFPLPSLRGPARP